MVSPLKWIEVKVKRTKNSSRMRPHSTSKHDSPYIPYTQRLKQISPTPRQALKQSFNNTEIK